MSASQVCNPVMAVKQVPVRAVQDMLLASGEGCVIAAALSCSAEDVHCSTQLYLQPSITNTYHMPDSNKRRGFTSKPVYCTPTAITVPQYDADTDTVFVNTTVINMGTQPLVLRKGSVVAWATKATTDESQAHCSNSIATEPEPVAAVHETLAGAPTASVETDGLPVDHPEFGKPGEESIKGISSTDSGFKQWFQKHKDSLTVGDAQTPPQLVKKMWKLLYCYREVFAENPSAPSPIDGVEHAIDFIVGQVIVPKKERLRRCNPKELQEMYKHTEKMLKDGIIRPSTSPWAASVIMVPKPSDPLKGLRYCVDYRYLNKFTVTDAMILPRVDDLLDSLVDSECFSMMDAAAGFWGVKIKQSDIHKTGFNTWTHGAMEFVRMPFGLKNSPATFQRALGNILHPYATDPAHPISEQQLRTQQTDLQAATAADKDKVLQLSEDDKSTIYSPAKRFASLYIDDICVHGTFADHINHVAKILKRLRGNNVSLKMVKCKFAVTEGAFLGHMVKAGQGIFVDPKKVEGIVAMKRPRTVSAIRTFLGAASYLRKFIPDFADLSQPLRQVQSLYPSKHSVIEDKDWTSRQQAAFDGLKAALVAAPVLAFPDFSKPFILLTDASNTQLGAALVQCSDDGTERPLAYASRALNKHECKYGITDKEGAALTWATRMWRHYLTGSKVVAVTDHSALCHLLTKPHLRSARQERYALDLMELDITVCHRAGSAMELADCLSRADMDYDKSRLEGELKKLVDKQAQALTQGQFMPGTELHKWQQILANRSSSVWTDKAQVPSR